MTPEGTDEQKLVYGEAGYVLEVVPHLTNHIPDLLMRYKPFVEACIDADEKSEALKYIPKLTDPREKSEAYARIGMAKEAADAASQAKDSELFSRLKLTLAQNAAAASIFEAALHLDSQMNPTVGYQQNPALISQRGSLMFFDIDLFGSRGLNWPTLREYDLRLTFNEALVARILISLAGGDDISGCNGRDGVGTAWRRIADVQEVGWIAGVEGLRGSQCKGVPMSKLGEELVDVIDLGFN
ncbi:hypothetical protein KSP40_PGU017585 [Platanthera guangdongensis]|uniref:Vps16 C-terminal domain-containing protein n=1 Tax=Platanthera guangdongensis TaxID=2320717 RepID=A0ABR2M4P7_9ASPA